MKRHIFIIIIMQMLSFGLTAQIIMIDLGTKNTSFTYTDTQNTEDSENLLFPPNYYAGNYIVSYYNDVFYKFTITQPMKVIISHCDSELEDTYIHLLDVNLYEIISIYDISDGCCENTQNPCLQVELSPGTYFIQSEGLNGNGNITTNITGYALIDVGNQTSSFAYSHTQNTENTSSIYGQGYNEAFYRFTLPSLTGVTVSHCGSELGSTNLYLLDDAMEQIDAVYNNGGESLCPGSGHSSLQRELPAGTYYVVSEGYAGNGNITTNITGVIPPKIINAGTKNDSFTYTHEENTQNARNAYGQSGKDIFYRFTLSVPVSVHVSHCAPVMNDTYLYLLNDSMNVIASAGSNGSCGCNDNSGPFLIRELPAGTYYAVSEGSSENGIIRTTIQSFDFRNFSKQSNYIHTRTYTSEDTTSYLDALQYFDGLGRPMQTIQKGITPNKSDLVSIQEYDAVGRESKSWLPAPIAGNGGIFADFNTVKTSAISTYNNDSRPFSEPVYEPSPLNRVMAQYGPGNDWHTAGRSIKTDWLTNNSTALKCAYYHVSGDNLVHNGDYAPGQLYVTKHTDEDNNVSYEFKDKLGQVVMTRQINAGINHDTYYVYDDFGLKRYVLPPIASDETAANGTYTPQTATISKYAYIYRYDARKRQIWKKLPGCEPVYFVYDKADRLILSQDGVQRSKNEWAFNKYDALGRLLISGVYADTHTHAELCEELDTMLVSESQGGAYGYTWDKLPRITYDKALLVNYYDDYQHLLIQEPYFQTHLSYEDKPGYGTRYVYQDYPGCSANGLLVGTRMKLLNGTGETVTAMYYDDKGRIVQQKSTSHLGGIGKEYFSYTFTGKRKEALIEYEGDIVICGGELSGTSNHYVYEYDHAERLKTITLNGTVVESNTFNQLGQLQNKRQGDGISSSYTYNIRDWLKSINGTMGAQFQQTLYYQDNNDNKYYTGNISKMSYQHNENPLKTFHYQYDNLNRLTAAQIDNGNFNDAEDFSYDKHGNPTEILRTVNGQTSDLLNISYNGNQKTTVSNGCVNTLSSAATNYPATNGAFTCNANGSVISDSGRDMVTIRYNVLNLPDTIQFGNGNAIYYTYNSAGTKLRTKYVTVKPGLVAPVTVSQGEVRPLSQSEIQSILITDYVGDQIFENGELKMTLFPGGYMRRMMTEQDKGGPMCQAVPHYYLKDYLGNNREVVRDEGFTLWTTTQRTEYTPFGVPYPQTVGDAGEQPFKFGGKEWDRMHGLNYYDFHARMYDPVLISFLTPDPLAEKRPWISPYAYCSNNPASKVDSDGRWDISVHVYSDRKEYGYGVAIVTDRNGNEVYRFNVRAEGANGHNRTQIGADTPLGTYDIPDTQPWITGGSRASYGPNARLNMIGESGEIVESGRTDIRIHGGRQEIYNSKTNAWTTAANPQLKKTYGCLRAYDANMATFKETVDNLQVNDALEIPGTVTVKNDLQKVITPASTNNMVEVKVEYKVPEQELNYWQSYINNLFNYGK